MRRMRHLKPREIQGCQLALDASIATSLYDATSGGSLVAADGMVKRWEDQSGNGYNVTEATNGPQRKVATMNGCDTLYFDGVNNRLAQSAASQSKFFHVAAGSTFAAVAHFGTGSNPDTAYTLADNTAGSLLNAGPLILYDDRSSLSRYDMIGAQMARAASGTTVSSLFLNNKITPNAAQTISMLFDNGNATANLRQRHSVNGAPEYGGNVSTFAASSANPAHPFVIGAFASSSSFPLLGYISEINGWNRLLPDAVRLRISNSRQRKWRING